MNLFDCILIRSSIVFVTVSLIHGITDARFNVKVSNVTSTSVELSWSPYSADAGTPKRGYVVSYKVRTATAADPRSPDVVGDVVTDTHYAVQSLDPSTQYEFTVSAVTAVNGTAVEVRRPPSAVAAVVATTRHVECLGTNMNMNMIPPIDLFLHYQNLRNQFANCTYVNGNLELTWLRDEDFDSDFLYHIQEITGYVLITEVYAKKIVLPRLKIIWGRTRYKHKSYEFSLLITSTGVYNVELPSLREIMAGNVGTEKNSYICHFNTINWDDIINSDGNKWTFFLLSGFPKRKCPPCNELCTSCWGVGLNNCQKFSKINCSVECNQSRCFEPSSGGCCHPFCAGGCIGPKRSDCLSCLHSYEDGACTGEHPTTNHPTLDLSPGDDKMTPKLLYGAVVTYVSVNVIGILLIIRYGKKRARVNEEAVNMAMELTRIEDDFSLRLSNVQPNTAKLRIIKEADLRIGAELGNGAFGVVNKGIWIVEGKTMRIPVAIKTLHKKNGARGSENASKEFLDEAYLMARVDHRNLVKLLAVCMTSEPMLVTELMPLGCLLNYVRNNKSKIGSKSLMKWSSQIANGMAYLEENRLVHRDLAARNVLVQNARNVKISDFGLAKLLDTDQLEYTANGGKMPVKWLAPECLKYGVFTHKSDVWAFGVTVWELLTYGEQPYGGVDKNEMPMLLDRGERLPQPSICTIDVYMVMVKCWLTEKESRPSFKELAEEFSKMAVDPGRYLVITGDRFMRPPASTSPRDDSDTLSNLANEGATANDAVMQMTDECGTGQHVEDGCDKPVPQPAVRSSSAVDAADLVPGAGAGRDTVADGSNTTRVQCTPKSDTSVDEDGYLLPFSIADGLDKKRRHSFPDDVQQIGCRYVAMTERSASFKLLMSPSLACDRSLKSAPIRLSAVDNPEYHLTGGKPSGAVVTDVSSADGRNEDGAEIPEVSQSVTPSALHLGISQREKSDHESRCTV